jgi:hypothetical protein
LVQKLVYELLHQPEALQLKSGLILKRKSLRASARNQVELEQDSEPDPERTIISLVQLSDLVIEKAQAIANLINSRLGWNRYKKIIKLFAVTQDTCM